MVGRSRLSRSACGSEAPTRFYRKPQADQGSLFIMSLRRGNGRCDWGEYWRKKRQWEARCGSLRRSLFSRDENKCARCGCLEKLTVDHIKPLRKDGTNDLENLQILCLECNRSKGIS